MNTCIHPTLSQRLRPLAILAFAFAGAFHVHAQTPAVFGMVGVTASDIARLNVVVLPSPATPSAHAGCRIALGFLAIDGRVVKQDIRTVYPGRATHFDLSGVEAALPPGPVALRIPVRPVVEIAPIQTGDVCRMVASFELFDSTSGRGLLFSLPAPMVGPQ